MRSTGLNADRREKTSIIEERLRELAVMQAVPDVEERVWAEIDRRLAERRTAARPVGRLLAVPALAAVVIAIVAVSRIHAPAPIKQGLRMASAVPLAATADRQVSGRSIGVKAGSPVVRRDIRSARKTVRRHAVALAYVERRHRRRMHNLQLARRLAQQRVRLARNGEPSQSTRHGAAPGPPPGAVWASWAAWYEQQGDYDRAAIAYQQAAHYTGSRWPGSFTYEAGRAAECAGDISTAVENYSKMLSRASGAPPRPKAEKGAQIWTPSGNEA